MNSSAVLKCVLNMNEENLLMELLENPDREYSQENFIVDLSQSLFY